MQLVVGSEQLVVGSEKYRNVSGLITQHIQNITRLCTAKFVTLEDTLS